MICVCSSHHTLTLTFSTLVLHATSLRPNMPPTRISSIQFILPSAPSPYREKPLLRESRNSPVTSLAELPYSPPTPPLRPIEFFRSRISQEAEPKQRKKVIQMRIRKLNDPKRIIPNWMLNNGIKPFNYTLIPLEVAQRREDIVYRSISGPLVRSRGRL